MLGECGVVVESDGLRKRGSIRPNTVSIAEMVSAAVLPMSRAASVTRADRAKTGGIRGEAALRSSGEGIGAFGPHRPPDAT